MHRLRLQKVLIRLCIRGTNSKHMATDQPLLITIEEASRLLSVSRSTIYRMIKAGTLPIVRPLPDAPRIARADVELLISRP